MIGHHSSTLGLHVSSPFGQCALARKGGPGSLAPLGGEGKQEGLGGRGPPNSTPRPTQNLNLCQVFLSRVVGKTKQFRKRSSFKSSIILRFKVEQLFGLK